MHYIQTATSADSGSLVNLITAFREHLDQEFPKTTEISGSLEKLMADDSTDFLLVFTDSNVAVAYTQIRYYYSLWSTDLEAQMSDRDGRVVVSFG